jgi:lipopolysaccharide transport system permease protein
MSEIAKPLTIIEPPRGWVNLGLGELWQYRDLLGLLVWRDFSSRYRQSLIGFGWALIRPVVSMLVFTLIFGKMAKLPSDGAPYAIFNYAGLLPWLFFAGCLTSSSQSLVQSQTLVTKVYFPRLILPLSKVAVSLIDFAIQFVLLLVLMVLFHVTPTWRLALIPAFLLLAILTSLAVGILMTAVNVKYRDIRQVVPFVTQTWMWITPVVYSTSMIDPQWRFVYGLNPLVGIVDGFRWAILGTTQPDWKMMAISSSVTVALMVFSLIYFRRAEATFADII